MSALPLPELVYSFSYLCFHFGSASEEKYQVNVLIPSSESSGPHIRVPEGEVLTVCVVMSITSERLLVTVKGDTDPANSSAIGKNHLFINLL